MPRSGGGVMSWPPNTVAIPNTTIASDKYNAFLADLLADLNAARPITAGGTGAITAIGANDALSTTSANIASAATTDLATATGVSVTITGTATITSFGTRPSGVLRFLTFAGAATLTHNATSLILPGAANIVTAAGDTAVAQSLGGGNWQIRSYQKASGQPVANLNAPTITGPVTINSSASGTMLSLNSTDPGAAAGPVVTFDRNSASPAAADVLAAFIWTGRTSTGAGVNYGSDFISIVDATNATYASTRTFATAVGGVFGVRMVLGAGLYMTGATGSDQGAGTFNATEYYKNGARLLLQQPYESAQQTITSAGALTLAHGLAAQPKLYQAFIKCTTANLGYAIGDEVGLMSASMDATAGSKGLALWPDATNMNVRYGQNAGGCLQIPNKTTGSVTAITNGSWALIVRAWA